MSAARSGAKRAGARPRPAPHPPGLAARRGAATLVEGVLERGLRLSDQTGPDGPLAALAPPDRARAGALAAIVLRELARIDHVLARFLDRPPAGRARTALRLATAELLAEGIPPHAAVDAAVSLARAHPRARHLAPLVNAVARRVAAEGPPAWAAAPPPALPSWLAGPVTAAWGGATAAAIAEAHRRPPPLDLTPKRAGEARAIAGRIGAEVLPTGSLRLPARGQVSALPGYAEGAWWVQDAAAALPARLLGPVAGRRVLDLCAAPGGKTLQLAAAGAEVTALDLSASRLARLTENLARTRLAARVVAADALAWAPPAPFAAILLDAPCTASGTIRRHPDLPHLRGGEAVPALAALQARLLDRAWTWLAPGGVLVFATCSLLPAEGEDQAAAFLARTPQARRLPAPADLPPGWVDAAGALRTRPDLWAGRGGVDGFYAVALVKAEA